jgi:DNA (cytosine-5)-methyltransferase 1
MSNIVTYKTTKKYTLKVSSKSDLLHEDQLVYERRREGELIKSKESYKLIDLFCGAGGMTLGFTKSFGHSFEPVWANDYNKYCVETYKANFGDHCVAGDLIDILKNSNTVIPEADVVIGGPPCQGFSLLNKNRDGDPRRELWKQFLDIVERSKAKVFIIENVPQLLGSFEHGEIEGYAKRLGFKVISGKLSAADYGVPQTRVRAFIIGSKTDDPSILFPPRKTHYNPISNGQHKIDFSNNSNFLPSPEKWRTVRDAISDLPIPEGTEIKNTPSPENLHFGRTPTQTSLMRYRAIPKEGMNRSDLQKNAPELTPECWIRKKSGGTDLFGRLWWDKPAFTIRTEFFKPEKGRYLHPQQDRPITHREAARLQSFPDSFIFKGSKIEIAKQIGNAVPPLLAARIADIAFVLLSKGNTKNGQIR